MKNNNIKIAKQLLKIAKSLINDNAIYFNTYEEARNYLNNNFNGHGTIYSKDDKVIETCRCTTFIHEQMHIPKVIVNINYDDYEKSKLKMADLNDQQKVLTDEYANKRDKNLSFGTMFNQQRTYFPLQNIQDIECPDEIKQFLKNLGYIIVNYAKGEAKKDDNKDMRTFAIGRLLNRNKCPQQIYKLFMNRGANKKTQHKKLLMCITHNPYDVAGMSTNRIWNSCMSLQSGSEKDTVLKQVQYGGMCAYLIDEDDKQIHHPYLRVAIKRLEADNGAFIFIQEPRVYQNQVLADSVSFQKKLKQILDQSNKQTMKQQILFSRNDDNSKSDGDIYHALIEDKIMNKNDKQFITDIINLINKHGINKFISSISLNHNKLFLSKVHKITDYIIKNYNIQINWFILCQYMMSDQFINEYKDELDLDLIKQNLNKRKNKNEK